MTFRTVDTFGSILVHVTSCPLSRNRWSTTLISSAHQAKNSESCHIYTIEIYFFNVSVIIDDFDASFEVLRQGREGTVIRYLCVFYNYTVQPRRP
jgi:hypothetical protein